MRKSKLGLFAGLGVMVLGLLAAAGCAVPTEGEGTTTGGFDYTIIIFIVIIFGAMYLLMIRPQRKKQKEQQRLLSELKRGDEVITNAGIYGTIDSIDENTVILKLESGATMRISRSVIAGKKEQFVS